MHYSKRGGKQNTAAVSIPTQNFGILAKAHPAFESSSTKGSVAADGKKQPQQGASKDDKQQQQSSQQLLTSPQKNFELVSLRSPKPPAASEQQKQQQQQQQQVPAPAAQTARATASAGKPPRGNSPPCATARAGSGSAAAVARTDSLSSLKAAAKSGTNESGTNDQQQQPKEISGEESDNSRALVPTPKSLNAPLVSLLPTSPTAVNNNNIVRKEQSAAVVVTSPRQQQQQQQQQQLLSDMAKAPTPSSKLSDSRLPVVGSSFIVQNRRGTIGTPAATSNKQVTSPTSPTATTPSGTASRATGAGGRGGTSFSSLPPISLTHSRTLMQQLSGAAAAESFADVHATNSDSSAAAVRDREDLGAALTLFSAAAPAGPLSSRSASQRNPKHWTDMLPSMAHLEESAGVLLGKSESSSGGAAAASGVSSPTSSSQVHHSVPPLAAELLGFIRKELKFIYAPIFEKQQQQQQQQQQKYKSSSASSLLPAQLVHSPDVKLARWRVFLDAFRNLAGHFKEYGPFMNIILRETEDMYSALQQHGRDRSLFALVANQAEGVAEQLARETTQTVFDELHLTKRRNHSMQESLKQLDEEIIGLKQRLSVSTDERAKVGSELDAMTSRCKTFMEALQGEANRQNAAFAEAKAIREDNERLRANVRSLEEQRKNDSLLQEELFSKLDQLSLAMSEGGLNFSKVMEASPTARAKMFSDGAATFLAGAGSGGSGGTMGEDDDDDNNSPYSQRENIHSLEGMRRWGSMLHLNMMKAQQQQQQQQDGGNDQQQDGDGEDQDETDRWINSRRRTADRRLSTVMDGLLSSGNNKDDESTGGSPTMGSSGGGGAASFSSANRPSPQRRDRVANEAKRDREALLREKMMKESMKFAASCSGDTAAEKLQEALLRCFAKVRKYRSSISVLRQTIERMEKKIQKIGNSAMQQQMIIQQQQQSMARSGTDVFGAASAGNNSGPPLAATSTGSGRLQPSWSMRFAGESSGAFGPSTSSGVFQQQLQQGASLGALGRQGSMRGGVGQNTSNALSSGNVLNQQMTVNMKPSEAAELVRFDSQRPLTPRPQWARLQAVVPKFDPDVDPETGVLPSSDDLLEQLAERLREQQSEKLKEIERKVLSNRVSGWVDEEHSNSKTHRIRASKASDITSLLMASSRSFVGLGGGPEVPPYLRYSGRLRNKLLGKGDCEVLLKRFWKARRDAMLPTLGGAGGAADDDTTSNNSFSGARDYAAAINGAYGSSSSGGGGGRGSDLAADLALGNASFGGVSSSLTSQALHGVHEASFAVPIEDFYQQWLQQQTGNPKAAIELAYSINDVCERYQHDPDCGMFLKIMRGVISEQCLAHEMYVVEQLRKVLSDLDSHNTGQLPRSMVYRVLKQLFPSKRYGDALRLRFALLPFTTEDDEGHAFVRYADVFDEDSEGNQTAFIERLRHQHFDEALEVLVEIETSVRETQQTTGTRRQEMPIWQIAHSVRNIDGRMPTSSINHILAVGAACAPSVVQDALDRHASDVTVDIEDFFKRVRRGVFVRRYSPPPEDDIDLLQEEEDDADVEDAEEGNDEMADAARLRELVDEAKAQEESEGTNLASVGRSRGEEIGTPTSTPGTAGAAEQSKNSVFDEIPDAGGAFVDEDEEGGSATGEASDADSASGQQQRSRRGTTTGAPQQQQQQQQQPSSNPSRGGRSGRGMVSILSPQDDDSSFAINGSFGGGNELLTL